MTLASLAKLALRPIGDDVIRMAQRALLAAPI